MREPQQIRRTRVHLAVMAVAVGLLTACSGGSGGGNTSPTAEPSVSATAAPSSSAAPTPSADAETTQTAPAPEPSQPPSSGPGQGTAELSIAVIPAEGQAAVNYTLVCQDGVASAESSHPTAAAACAALKANAAILSPNKPVDQACTQQYGGPETATVSGVLDGTPVDASFSRTDGCTISAWNAAHDVLGVTGGAV